MVVATHYQSYVQCRTEQERRPEEVMGLAAPARPELEKADPFDDFVDAEGRKPGNVEARRPRPRPRPRPQSSLLQHCDRDCWLVAFSPASLQSFSNSRPPASGSLRHAIRSAIGAHLPLPTRQSPAVPLRARAPSNLVGAATGPQRAADFSMPMRNVRLEPSTNAPPRLSPNISQHDTPTTSGTLENGLQSGDKDPGLVVKHLLLEDSSSEESTPFLDIEENCSRHRAPTLLSRWMRRWRSRSRRNSALYRRKVGGGGGGNSASAGVQTHSLPYPLKRRPSLFRSTLYLLGATLMLLGIVQFLSIVFGGVVAFFPDELDWVLDNWGEVGQPSEGLSRWPTDFTGDIKPVACHSHNDYWRKIPLYSAIHAGCIGVEADVWLFDEELYVGHSLSSLTPNRTLNNLYINPLLDILEKQNPISPFHPTLDTPPNGVFDTLPTQTLILLIDYKTSGKPLHPYVVKQLDPLRQKGYLTHFNGTDVVEGPITIVATGNAPFDLIMRNSTYRDVFFDAPLDQMADESDGSIPGPNMDPLDGTRDDLPANPYSPYNEAASSIRPLPSAPTAVALSDTDQGQGHSGGAPLDPAVYSAQNSYYASVSFTRSIGFPWRSRLSAKQLELVRKQIRGAHAQGLKVRYWSLPSWPRGLRNHIWHVLVREGVDVLNVDDLVGATRRDWRKGKGWWY